MYVLLLMPGLQQVCMEIPLTPKVSCGFRGAYETRALTPYPREAGTEKKTVLGGDSRLVIIMG